MDPDCYIFPYTEKHKNHLLRYLILVTSSNLLQRCMFDCTHSLAQLLYILGSPPTSLEQSPQSY